MRGARLAAYLFGGAAALGAAAYLVIYLHRWQWQRTILCGVLLLVVEVLLGLALLDRVGRLERRLRAAGLLLVAPAGLGLFETLAELPPGTRRRDRHLGTVSASRATASTAIAPPQAARQLWERCRDSTAVPLERAGLATLDDGLFAATTHPSLSDHDVHRLLGCLEDASVDRVRLRIVGAGSIGASGW